MAKTKASKAPAKTKSGASSSSAAEKESTLSVAISDIPVAASALIASQRLHLLQQESADGSPVSLAAAAFTMIAVAATLGVVRFSQVLPQGLPQTLATFLHSTATNLSSSVGLPALALHFAACFAVSPTVADLAQDNAMPVIAALLGMFFLNAVLDVTGPSLRLLLSGVSLFSIVGLCCHQGIVSGFQSSNLMGAAGAFIYIFAGLVIGTTGRMFGIKCVDWFHYAISIANLLFLHSLLDATCNSA